MSLITCCPACGTMFRVVPDQLRISDGWVRCGHCAEVFDATAHMAAEPPALHDAPETVPMAPLPEDADPAPVAAMAPTAAAPVPEPAPLPAAQPPLRPVAAPAVRGARDSELDESPLDQPFVFRRSDLGASEGIPSVSPPVIQASRPQPSRLDDDEPDLHDVSFVRQARRRQFWRRPLARTMLVLALFALTGLLVLQYALHERDRLAATEPALRPWLQRMCLALPCRIEPPRAIEALAIETSSFNKLRGDAYRLNFTLKNNAAMQVAAPSMELTLTDGQDQPLLRRVLTPAELGAAAPVLPAGGEWSASVPLAIDGNGRIAGYRLLAFYP